MSSVFLGGCVNGIKYWEEIKEEGNRKWHSDLVILHWQKLHLYCCNIVDKKVQGFVEWKEDYFSKENFELPNKCRRHDLLHFWIGVEQDVHSK